MTSTSKPSSSQMPVTTAESRRLSLQARRAADDFLAGRPPLEEEDPIDPELIEMLLSPDACPAKLDFSHGLAAAYFLEEISQIRREQDTQLDPFIEKLRDENIQLAAPLGVDLEEVNSTVVVGKQWIAVHAPDGVAAKTQPQLLWIGPKGYEDVAVQPMRAIHCDKDGLMTELTTTHARQDDQPLWTPGGSRVADFFGASALD